MRRLTWDYIIGFFEGEGCVSTHANQARRGSIGTRVIMSQAGEIGKDLLLEVRDFLLEHGIRAYLHRSARKTALRKDDRPNSGHMYNLSICDRQGSIDFLRRVLPSLRIKKLIAQDSVRFLTAFPSIKGWYFRELNQLRKEAKTRGEKHVAVPYNSPRTLRAQERAAMAYLQQEMTQ